MVKLFLWEIQVTGPDGAHFRVEITSERITIGRYKQFNDVALDPDPQQLVTRKVHCVVERDRQGWHVLDNGSVNRTFLRHDAVMQAIEGRARPIWSTIGFRRGFSA